MPTIEELQQEIRDVRIMAEDALDKFPLRSTTTSGAVRERHIHDLGKHPGGVIAARVFNSANITGIVTATETALTFDSERFDTDTIHSTSSNTGRLTAKTAGKYFISGTAQWSTAVSTNVQIVIRLNGTTRIARSIILGVDYRSMAITTQFELAVDDYVELLVFQQSGSDKIIQAISNESPEFMMSRIGAAGTVAGGSPGADHGDLTGLGDDDHSLYLLAAGTRAGSTGSAQDFGSTGIKTDIIAESTANANITFNDPLQFSEATGVIIDASGDQRIQIADAGTLTFISTPGFTFASGTAFTVANQTLMSTSGGVGIQFDVTNLAIDIAAVADLNVESGNIQTSDETLLVLQAGSNDSLRVIGSLVADGKNDRIQLRVQGHSTQTTDLAVFEQSDGTDVFTVSNAGNGQFAGTLGVTGATTLSSTVAITDKLTVTDDVLIDGKADQVQLTVQGHSTQATKTFVVQNNATTTKIEFDPTAGAADINFEGPGFPAVIGTISREGTSFIRLAGAAMNFPEGLALDLKFVTAGAAMQDENGNDRIEFNSTNVSSTIHFASTNPLTTGNGAVLWNFGTATAQNVTAGLGFTLASNTADPTTVQGGSLNAAWSGTGTAALVLGAEIFASLAGTGTVTDMMGARSQVRITAAGSVTTSNTYKALSPDFSGAQPTTHIGVAIADQSVSGTTTSVALDIDAQSGATTPLSIRVLGSAVSIHQPAMTIGGTSAPTSGFILDVQGDAIVNSRDVNRYAYSV